jgi:hypothetical protein
MKRLIATKMAMVTVTRVRAMKRAMAMVTRVSGEGQ